MGCAARPTTEIFVADFVGGGLPSLLKAICERENL